MILKYQFSETKRVLDDATIAKIIQMGEMNLNLRKLIAQKRQYKVIEKVLYLGSKEINKQNLFTIQYLI